MKPKYNSALDLIACASDSFKQGNMKEASAFVTRAFKAADCAEAIEAMLHHNEAAVQAGADDAPDMDFPGEELRLEPDENKPREVQESRAIRARRARATSSVTSARQRATDYFATLKK